MTAGRREALETLLRQRGNNLYALYDAAQYLPLLDVLRNRNITHFNLFSGVKAFTLSDVAPYLVPCAPFLEATDFFMTSVWQNGISMLVESKAPAEEIRLQLKKSILIKNAKGVECYFRFYDARAWSRFMRVVSTGQLEKIFGNSLQTIYWDDPTADGILALTRQQGGMLFSLLMDMTNRRFDIKRLS